MKIGIESQRIFRSHKHGMDVVAVELISRLQQLDTENQYFLFARNGPDRTCVRETPNFQVRLIKGITYGDWEQISLPRALRKQRPDFIHCTANTAPIRCPVPLIVTLHDIIFLRETNFAGTAYQNFGNIYRRFIVPYAIRNARKIITVSEEERKIIIDACDVDPSKMEVVHNAVHERFSQVHGDDTLNLFRKKYRLPSAYILHLGNTAPKKNTPSLVRAYVAYLQQTKDALPLVIADYPERLVRKLLHPSESNILEKQIIFTGYVPALEMPLLYAAATLFIYPSLAESFGLPVLESMASGTPVITSDIGALKEVGGDAAMYTDPTSEQSIAAAITHALSHPEVYNRLKQAGYLRAREFSWTKSAQKLLSIYNQMK